MFKQGELVYVGKMVGTYQVSSGGSNWVQFCSTRFIYHSPDVIVRKYEGRV